MGFQAPTPDATGVAVSTAYSSGNVAAATATATIPAVAGKTNYLTGYVVTASGATAGLPVNFTITGCVGGTITNTFVFPAGVLVGAVPLVVILTDPLAATGPNVAVVGSLPSSGAGGTNASVTLFGYNN